MIRRAARSIVGLGLFGGAIWLLQRELRAYNFQDVYHALGEIPNLRLLLALGLTAANFLVLSGVDLLALRFIGRRIEYRKILFASFSGFAVSQSLGFPLITAATVRYRLYSRWGISPQDVTNILAFCGLTFFLGLFAILGVVLLGKPAVPTEVLRLPGAMERYFGLLLLLIVAAYLAWSAYRQHPLRVLNWRFPVAPIRISLAQIGVSALEWLLLVSIFYTLLPPGLISYPGLLQIVVLAQLAGILSNVPGGLGVFEAVIFLLLPEGVPEDLILASLLAYRGIYTLLPLLIATTLLAGHEVAHRRQVRPRPE
jgi:uncharacterized membrane protein YbhN (UPF0104 family)